MDKWQQVREYVDQLMAGHSPTVSRVVNSMATKLPGCHVPLAECRACQRTYKDLVEDVKTLLRVAGGRSPKSIYYERMGEEADRILNLRHAGVLAAYSNEKRGADGSTSIQTMRIILMHEKRVELIRELGL